MAFSPDGRWVLTGSPSSNDWTVVPTGIGQPRHVRRGDVVQANGMTNGNKWLDATRIVFVGSEEGRRRRLYVQNLDGAKPDPVTPDGAAGPFVVSPDASVVVVQNPEGRLARYPLAGGNPTPLAGADNGDQPLAWSPDGRNIWVLNRTSTPARIFRIDLATAQRTLWRDIPYRDPAATDRTSLRVVMPADGTRFVYGYMTRLSQLYVATGLR
jgi:Tol biopolymer transport system component